jgi:hypothetical protein
MTLPSGEARFVREGTTNECIVREPLDEPVDRGDHAEIDDAGRFRIDDNRDEPLDVGPIRARERSERSQIDADTPQALPAVTARRGPPEDR